MGKLFLRARTAVLAFAVGALLVLLSQVSTGTATAQSVAVDLARPPIRVQDWPVMQAWMRGQSIKRASSMCPTDSDADLAKLGVQLFGMYCVNCHGEGGRGNGPRAPVFEPPPRDLTRGLFKFRSTPSGTPPTREDLFQTLSGGLHGTGMPAFADLPELERWALVAYLRTLSPRFAGQADFEPLPLPAVPANLSDRVARGAEVYRRVQCNSCHGERGRGDGPAAATLFGDGEHAVRTPDFAITPLKYGNTPESIYRTLVTGLDGTPMPSYAEALSQDELWDVVAFVRTLVGDLSSPKISARDVAEARAFVQAQRQQASHAVIGGCGCQARRRR